MEPIELSNSLCNHALLPGPGDKDQSFSYIIRSARTDEHVEGVILALEDLLELIEDVNRIVNKPTEEPPLIALGESFVDRSWCYHVQRILDNVTVALIRVTTCEPRMPLLQQAISRSAHELHIAWSAVLAGDIESIRELVRLEAGARLWER